MKARDLGIAVALTGITALSRAETEPEPALDEVVVTAEKRPEHLQQVAASVDVLTAAGLDQLQIKEAADISSTVPNLVVARNDTYSNSTIVLRSLTQAN